MLRTTFNRIERINKLLVTFDEWAIVKRSITRLVGNKKIKKIKRTDIDYAVAIALIIEANRFSVIMMSHQEVMSNR